VGQGILEWSNGKLRLTDRGRRDYEREQAAQQTTARSLKWDGAWRVLIFDIPEHRRKQRLQLRFQLKRIGFIRLQDSVWVYPYDCEDFVVLLKADLKIGKDLLYIIADSLEGDEPLRKHFKLKQRQ
jgi:DNA-binding transcriptional regulator PaaX